MSLSNKYEVVLRKIEERDNILLAKIIRQVFDEHDAPKCGTVYSDPTTNNLFNLFQVPSSVLWVAHLDNQIIGCCGIYPTVGLSNDCAELVKFYLLKEARGKGIGKKLMQKCIDSAKEFGFRQLYLESMPQFANAVNMYEKEGFMRLNHPLGDSKHTSCSIWMIKDLSNEGTIKMK
jgi:putative acetyltransferase